MSQDIGIDKILKARLTAPEYALVSSLISSERAQVEHVEQVLRDYQQFRYEPQDGLAHLACSVRDVCDDLKISLRELANKERSVENYGQWLKECYANVERKRVEIIALEAEVTRLKVEAPKRGKEFCDEVARKEKVIQDMLAKAREYRKSANEQDMLAKARANEKLYALETEARVQKQHELLRIHSTYGKFYQSTDSLRNAIAWKDKLLAERLTTIQNLQRDVLRCGENISHLYG